VLTLRRVIGALSIRIGWKEAHAIVRLASWCSDLGRDAAVITRPDEINGSHDVVSVEDFSWWIRAFPSNTYRELQRRVQVRLRKRITGE